MDLTADYLIVGSGIAALRAAIGLAGTGDVVLITKADPGESNTDHAQGGIAAAMAPDDSPGRHAEDTMAAGDGLCNPGAVEVLVHEGPRYVRELEEWGARFDRDEDGRLALAREAAHAVRRVLHARDATGREIGRALWARLEHLGRPPVVAHATAVEACLESGVCRGVEFLDRGGSRHRARARAVLLATGGAGHLFRWTTNPHVATGDGVALAFRAGAAVADLEFVQFHPTALDVPGRPTFLLSEALRGEGARLLNRHGEAFMTRYDPAGELAPRDRVARAIAAEAARTDGPITLSMQGLPAAWVRERFPSIAGACRAAGLDLATDLIPVKPAAHYMMGGVATDLEGRTTVTGLFAAGEVACTGVHGANRLASNSLLEGLVFGARAAMAMRRFVEHGGAWPEGTGLDTVVTPAPGGHGARTSDEIRQIMWHQVGLRRDGSGLLAAQAALADQRPGQAGVEPHLFAERENLRLVGWLMASAALRREESRGAHDREDFPLRDDERWRRHVADEPPRREPSTIGKRPGPA